jgi:queuine/archaeosine tRNA-ribosyltransferase
MSNHNLYRMVNFSKRIRKSTRVGGLDYLKEDSDE